MRDVLLGSLVCVIVVGYSAVAQDQPQDNTAPKAQAKDEPPPAKPKLRAKSKARTKNSKDAKGSKNDTKGSQNDDAERDADFGPPKFREPKLTPNRSWEPVWEGQRFGSETPKGVVQGERGTATDEFLFGLDDNDQLVLLARSQEAGSGFLLRVEKKYIESAWFKTKTGAPVLLRPTETKEIVAGVTTPTSHFLPPAQGKQGGQFVVRFTK